MILIRRNQTRDLANCERLKDKLRVKINHLHQKEKPF